jgi:hypothetical protein
MPLLKAIYLAARAKDSAAWSDAPPDESAIYEGLGITSDLNDVQGKNHNQESTSHVRWTLLCEALGSMRNALACAELKGFEHLRAFGEIKDIDSSFGTQMPPNRCFVAES